MRQESPDQQNGRSHLQLLLLLAAWSASSFGFVPPTNATALCGRAAETAILHLFSTGQAPEHNAINATHAASPCKHLDL